MCGIIGKIDKTGVSNDLLSSQLNLMRHRGPDSQSSIQIGPNVILGSARLAIQDLSSKGEMPMSDVTGRYTIVFNGEIYNFRQLRSDLEREGIRFSTGTDTEVVLYAYIHFGSKCLSMLTGMFAFAIYDNVTNLLFAARDRMGEKPFYYSVLDNGLSFGSQLNQLILDDNVGRALNYEALNEYFGHGYVSSRETLIKGVYKLMPGHYLKYALNDGKLQIEQYYELPKPVAHQNSDLPLIKELDSLMFDAVKSQLISDVEVGILLSGGVDSSLITSYAAEISHRRIKTYHISFNGFGKYNESDYARKVSKAYDTEHHELDGGDFEYDIIHKVVDYLDEPIADSSIIPTYKVAELVSKDLKVVLGGDGGDELFGGYTKYYKLMTTDKKVRKYIPEKLRNYIANNSKYLPDGLKGKNYMQSWSGSINDAITRYRIFDKHSIVKLLHKKESLNTMPLFNSSNDLLYSATLWDAKTYLPNDILTKVDRATMAHSLESRAPFLDKNILDFAFSKVPSSMKVNNSGLKHLPKQLLKYRLPFELDMDRKQGFSIPLDLWLRERWYDHAERDINNLEKLFNKDYVKLLLRNNARGYSNSSRIFAVLILDKWIKKLKIEY